MLASVVGAVRAVARTARLRLCASSVIVLAFAAACGSGPPAPGSPGGTGAPTATRATASPRPVPPPDACRQWACRAGESLDLSGKHAVTLWLGGDRQDYRSRPVVELRDQGVAVQWWVSPQGDGWNATLTCQAGGPEPNCALIASLGMHASVAELLILRGDRLVHPAGAQATTNSAGMSAADLDGDGYLDVIGSTNDYRPSYAQGHNYWQTFGYRDGRLVMTGCAPQPDGAPPPTHLLTGSCPMTSIR